MYSVTPIRAGYSGQATAGASAATFGKWWESNFADRTAEFARVERSPRRVRESPLATGDGHLV